MRLSPGVPQALTLALFCSAVQACGHKDAAAGVASVLDINSDASSLATRLDTQSVDLKVAEVVDGASLTGPSGFNLLSVLTAVQIGALTPPSVNGKTLQANSVFMDGAKAYISYNLAGDSVAGGVDQVNATLSSLPVLLASISSSTKEYNGVTKVGSTIYMVGDDPAADKPAFLQAVPLQNGLLASAAVQYPLPSYAGTDVVAAGTSLFVTSGDHGGLTVFDQATMNQASYTDIADARAVRANSAGTSLTVLSGQPGTATTFNAAGVKQTTYALGGATTAVSKSTLQVGSKWTAASLGEGGVKLYCNATGATMATIPAVTATGISAANSVTNAVAGTNGLLFTANGEAGIYIYNLKEAANGTPCASATVSLLGKLDFGASLSANSVYYSNGLLYVVTGLGGLRIVSIVYLGLFGDSTNFN